MLDWLMLLSQLALWVLVVQLYRLRSAAAQPTNSEAATERADESALEDEAVAAYGSQMPSPMSAPNLGSASGSFAEEIQGLAGQLEALAERFEGELDIKVAGVRKLLDELELRSNQLRGPERLESPAAIRLVGPSAGRAEPFEPVALGADAVGDPGLGTMVRTGLDVRTIARTIGRQQEEVDLLLQLAAQREGAHP